MRNDIKKTLEESISKSDLLNLGVDLSEIAVDQFLKDGIIKDLPVINSLVAFVKTGISIKDALYIKKLLIFLENIQGVSEEKRKKFLKEISLITEEKNRLFEKILSSIDRLDDSKKAILLAKVFKHLIVGNIDLIQYYRFARIIEDMLFDDIDFFFYRYGYYDNNDQTRQVVYNYMEKIGDDYLKEILIKHGLFELKEEPFFDESLRPNKIRFRKKEGLTKLGGIFAEMGFESRFYLENPIK
jgi:hypothetical protein